jgi:hypothetical protein
MKYFTLKGQDAFYSEGRGATPYFTRRNEKGEWLLVLGDGVTPLDKDCVEREDKDWDRYVRQGDWVEIQLHDKAVY